MQLLKADVLWDEGISSYLVGEYERLHRPLTTADLQQVANEHAVRVGDLLETLYLMAIDGAWHYCDDEGTAQDLDEKALDELYAKGRIGQDDLKSFTGVWIPAIQTIS